VFHEEDDVFYLGLGKTESNRYIIVSLGSAVTSNTLFHDADMPKGELQVLAPRVQNVEVSVSCLPSVQTKFLRLVLRLYSSCCFPCLDGF
jgi:protease II